MPGAAAQRLEDSEDEAPPRKSLGAPNMQRKNVFLCFGFGDLNCVFGPQRAETMDRGFSRDAAASP